MLTNVYNKIYFQVLARVRWGLKQLSPAEMKIIIFQNFSKKGRRVLLVVYRYVYLCHKTKM